MRVPEKGQVLLWVTAIGTILSAVATVVSAILGSSASTQISDNQFTLFHYEQVIEAPASPRPSQPMSACRPRPE